MPLCLVPRRSELEPFHAAEASSICLVHICCEVQESLFGITSFADLTSLAFFISKKNLLKV